MYQRSFEGISIGWTGRRSSSRDWGWTIGGETFEAGVIGAKLEAEKGGVRLDGRQTIEQSSMCVRFPWKTDDFFAPGSKPQAHGWSREEGIWDLELLSLKAGRSPFVSVTTSKATFLLKPCVLSLPLGKSVVLHLGEGHELRPHYW